MTLLLICPPWLKTLTRIQRTATCSIFKMAERKTMKDYGLVSVEDDIQSNQSDEPLDFLVPFLRRISLRDWKKYIITSPAEPGLDIIYYVSLSKQALVLTSAFLSKEFAPVRYTDMRLWEVIVDAWSEAGGQPEDLRYLAFYDIVNEAVRSAIEKEFESHKQQTGTLAVTPADCPTWKENAFARCADRVAKALSSVDYNRTIKVARAHLIQDAEWLDPELEEFNMEELEPNMYMVIELLEELEKGASKEDASKEDAAAQKGSHGGNSAEMD